MLCGLEGLQDVTVDGDEAHLTITVVSGQEPSHFSEHGTLKLVPAGFGTSPDVEQVTLVLEGRPAVTYDRAEVQDAVYGEALPRPVFLGLFSAKWLLESRGHLGEPDQSALVTLPLTDLHVFSIAAGFAEPLQAGNLRSAAATVDAARRRLQEVVPRQARTELTARADAELQVLADTMRRLADCCDDPLNGGDAPRAFAALHASVAASSDIGNAARTIRDDTAAAG